MYRIYWAKTIMTFVDKYRYISTQTSHPTDETGKRNGDLRNKMPVELNNMRKTVPSFEDR